ncbi:RICIN domain-containing protein [Halostagnicola sp. A-GB9-2]|uniref:RICIN domain-containing protein n=1 Tax=Halostagnicola sp. A-GB9-2 TaxID=3048066 RepID=UPI0024BF1ABD|nr:RICIN domain-containing protein [Halostagnicola sp. A-GB9-2]MDJ1433257.1 RICIN domain-containing protein [Halostagnicola sp. A-GB9-2]
MTEDSNDQVAKRDNRMVANGAEQPERTANTDRSGLDDGSLSMGRRGALAVLGATGLGAALAGSTTATRDPSTAPETGNQPWYNWDGDVDAADNGLYNLDRLQTNHHHTPAREPDVIVWENDEGCYQVDTDETTVYSGEEYVEAIQTAVDSLSEDRTVKERVLVTASGTIGPVDELTQIVLPSYTILDVAGTIRVEDDGDQPLVIPIRAFDEEEIEIPRLTITGNPRFAVWLQDSNSIKLGDIDIRFDDTDGFVNYWEVDEPDWPPTSFDPDASRAEILNDPGWVGDFFEAVRIDARAREDLASDVFISSVYVEGGRHHAVETYDVERVVVDQVIGVDMGGSAVILNETENAVVNSVVGENPESPTWYATFRCANGCENVSVGQVVSRDAPRGMHLTTESNEITVGEVNIIGARFNGIVVDDVENITIQGGLVKNVVNEAVTSTADGFSLSNLHVVDDLSEAERDEITLPDGDGAPDDPTQTHGIRFFGQNGRIVNNDVRNAGTKADIEVEALNTIVRDNLGGGIASGTVTLSSGADEAARVTDIHGRPNAAFDVRAELESVPSEPTAWTHYFEWAGDGWDLVFEWQTDPGEAVELSYIVDKTQAGDGDPELDPIEPGTYRINAGHTGMPLTVSDGTLEMDDWDDGDDQRWILEEDGDHYRLELEATGEVLEVEDGEIENGSNVQVAEDSGGDHQRWDIDPIFTPTGEFRYSMHPAGEDVGLDVEGGNEEPGTDVLLWSHTGVAHQQFEFDGL